MGKIKAISASYSAQGSLVLVDVEGRVWLKAAVNNQWSLIELPDEPAPEVVAVDIDMSEVAKFASGEKTQPNS